MPLALRERLDKDVAEGFLGNRRRVRFPNASFGKVWPVAAGLAAVWASVHVALKARRITLNTVQSTLRRLFDKQLLRREKVSHAHIYSPRLTQPEWTR